MPQVKIIISAFPWVPDFAKGNVRDLRVRWALEELGLSYEVKLIGRTDQKSAEYRKQQPFGQVPIYQEGGLTLFESGAIVWHLAEKSEILAPKDPHELARMRSWMFAALNSIEPFLMNLAEIDFFSNDQQWAKDHRADAVKALENRLQKLTDWLEGRDYLEERFTAADLLMSTVLNIARHTDIVKKNPVLSAYYDRCVDRPAYKRALEAQLSTFKANEPVAR